MRYIAVVSQYYYDFAKFVNEKGLSTFGERWARSDTEKYVQVTTPRDVLGYAFDEIVWLSHHLGPKVEEEVRSHARPGAIGGNGGRGRCYPPQDTEGPSR